MKAIIYAFLILYTIYAHAQEQEEYYRQPDRKQKTRVVNLPNLKGTPVRWYVGGTVGYFKGYNQLDNDLDGLIASSNYGNAYWGLNAGYNYGDKWTVELGYLSQYPRLQLSGVIGNNLPFRVTEGRRFDMFPIRYRRNIWAIDKDIRSANVFIGGGVILTTNATNKQIGSYKVTARQPFSPNTPTTRDSARINLFSTTKGVLKGEVSLEIQGRLTDFLTISAYVNGIVGLEGALRNDIRYTINSNTLTTTQFNKPFSYNMGLTFRYDYFRGVKYKSKIVEE